MTSSHQFLDQRSINCKMYLEILMERWWKCLIGNSVAVIMFPLIHMVSIQFWSGFIRSYFQMKPKRQFFLLLSLLETTSSHIMHRQILIILEQASTSIKSISLLITRSQLVTGIGFSIILILSLITTTMSLSMSLMVLKSFYQLKLIKFPNIYLT